MSSNTHSSPIMKEEDDIVEIKRAMATGGSGGKDSSSTISSVPPVVCYCLASILMTVVNKFVVSGPQFNMNFFLLYIQSTVSVLCVAFAKRLGLISFRDYDMRDAKAWYPISLMMVTVIYTGSKSLQYLSIPVYTIFKNLTIILIAYGEVLWFGGRVTGLTMISFVFMVLSSIIAAWGDVSEALTAGDPAVGQSLGAISTMKGVVTNMNIGYFWMLLNCLTSATYVLSMRKRIKSTGFSDWDTMFYNNLLSIPVLVLSSLIAEDWNSENLDSNFPEEKRNFLLSAIVFSGAAAVAISYTTAWCIRATSSTTYSMVGALNKLPVAASGMLFYGDPVTPGSVSAVGVGFGAGVVYAVAKNNQKKADSAAMQGVIPMSRKP